MEDARNTGFYLAIFEPSQLKSKDILVRLAYLIHGPFIHADIVFHPDDIMNAKQCLTHASTITTERRKVDEILGTTITRNSNGITMGWRRYRKPGYYWLFIPCTAQQLLHMERMACAFVEDDAPSTSFSLMGFIRCGVRCPERRPTEDTRSFFCSQYLATIMQNAGLLNPDLNPSSISVTELFIICMEQIPGCWPAENPMMIHEEEDEGFAERSKFKDAFDVYVDFMDGTSGGAVLNTQELSNLSSTRIEPTDRRNLRKSDLPKRSKPKSIRIYKKYENENGRDEVRRNKIFF